MEDLSIFRGTYSASVMTRLSLWVRYMEALIKEALGFMRTWILFGSDGGELQHKMLLFMLM